MPAAVEGRRRLAQCIELVGRDQFFRRAGDRFIHDRRQTVPICDGYGLGPIQPALDEKANALLRRRIEQRAPSNTDSIPFRGALEPGPFRQPLTSVMPTILTPFCAHCQRYCVFVQD